MAASSQVDISRFHSFHPSHTCSHRAHSHLFLVSWRTVAKSVAVKDPEAAKEERLKELRDKLATLREELAEAQEWIQKEIPADVSGGVDAVHFLWVHKDTTTHYSQIDAEEKAKQEAQKAGALEKVHGLQNSVMKAEASIEEEEKSDAASASALRQMQTVTLEQKVVIEEVRALSCVGEWVVGGVKQSSGPDKSLLL